MFELANETPAIIITIQMKATEQHCPAVIFVTCQKVVLRLD